MEIHVYTEYYHTARTLVIKSRNGETLKIYGDPSKALVFFILAGRRVKPAHPVYRGFITEVSEEEWTALKVVAKAKPSWRTLVETGLIEEPMAENILSSLLIEAVIE